MPEQLTPEQLAVVLGTAPSPPTKKQSPLSPSDDVFALASGELYSSRFDNEVLFYLDNSNQPFESKLYGGPAWPPIGGVGLWARVLSGVFLMNGTEGASEVERYLSILKHTASGELKSRAIDALQGVARFNQKISADLMLRVEDTLARAFSPENQQITASEKSL
ncbi:hypothetical protein [Terriglobus roseus]|uniref:Uncharacterized protein n=1 Tax=Terriglobus roseus TaxID=392734 RepID=A0A1G7GEB2_9BACT|nr:hypothetical protein [Terriglobus roseus]SDE86466.1 hypothetical protein SAMN05444167_0664 [Terriglobus roseus]